MLADRFDLVISDVKLPGTSGVELARHLCIDGTPVILITAFPSPEVERQAHREGVRCFIRKPFDPDELIERIEAALGKQIGGAQAFATFFPCCYPLKGCPMFDAILIAKDGEQQIVRLAQVDENQLPEGDVEVAVA